MLTLPSFNFLQTYDKGYEFFSYKNWHEHLENVYIGWLRRSKMAEITFRKWILACRKHLKIGRECDKCDIDKTTSAQIVFWHWTVLMQCLRFSVPSCQIWDSWCPSYITRSRGISSEWRCGSSRSWVWKGSWGQGWTRVYLFPYHSRGICDHLSDNSLELSP